MAIKMKQYPSSDTLRKYFVYRDGKLIWNINKQSIKNGDVAGSKSNGYKKVTIDREGYFLHRLIWIYFNGDIKDGLYVDHKDGDINNNKIENLQLLDNSKNQSKSKMSSKNTSGFRGVSYHKDHSKWVAHIRINGKLKHIGSYANIEDAAKAYDKHALEAFGPHAVLNFAD